MIDGWTRLINDTINFIPRFPEAFFSLLVGYLVIKLTEFFFVRALSLGQVPKALISILRSLLAVLLWIVLIAHVLRNLGLSQIAITLSGSLIVVGLAIANGAGTMVADIIGGLFLARDPDFDIGFRVKVGDIEGVVEAIDFRKSRLRTDNGQLVVIPNSLIDKDKWIILARRERGSVISTIKQRLRRKKEA